MKKCFYFPTWEEKLGAMISMDEEYLMLANHYDIFTMFCTYYEMPIGEGLRCYKKTVPSDQIFQRLCELTGATMYGDYVVFSFFQFNKIVENLNKLQQDSIMYFEQYSLFLQNKENKFEEIKKILDL